MYTTFHRIERFPKLVVALVKLLAEHVPVACSAATDAMRNAAERFQLDIPAGITSDRFIALRAQLMNTALFACFQSMQNHAASSAFNNLATSSEANESLFEEDTDTAARRNELTTQWNTLCGQQMIVQHCQLLASANFDGSCASSSSSSWNTVESRLQALRSTLSEPLPPHVPNATSVEFADGVVAVDHRRTEEDWLAFWHNE